MKLLSAPAFLIATLFIFICAPSLFGQAEASFVPSGGEISLPSEADLTEEQRLEIQAQLQIDIANLQAQGKIAQQWSALSAPSQFILPVRGQGAAANDYGIHGISNYVDQNPSFPNQLLDYNCGAKTYDTSTGYNHSGVDLFNFPFSWNKMDNNEVGAVAAADGVIIRKTDGNFDRNCAMGSGTANAIFLRHGDGTVTWYLHLKRNSLTAKNVGDSVVQGEFLGVVGSSGSSTGPHLHFETYDANNVLQDPYQGSCNTKNNFSYWINQPAYRDSKINKLMTHSAPPVFPSCPNPEITNEKNVFAPGSQLIVAAYYRDLQAGQQSQLSLIKPDNTAYLNWTFNSSATYNGSYWYWTLTLPANVPTGTWKFRVAYNSQTYEHSFFVGTEPTAKRTGFDFDGDGKSDASVFRPSNGVWYLNRSRDGFTGYQFGISTDRIVPADYDADGKTDIAVYRGAGDWFVQRSRDGFTSVNFGLASDVPVPADYDNDGKADIAVYRPSNGVWYIQGSTAGFYGVQLGSSEDKPVAADYDGDGKIDPAVYRPSNGVWYIQGSTAGFYGVQFGINTDKPTAADYDGDGKTDIAVYRPSNGVWYIQASRAGFYGVQFGIETDKPAPADFDGDGKTDIAVFRPQTGVWYINGSTSGFYGTQFGAAEDIPTPNSFVR